MAVIRPFRGLRYSSAAGNLDALVAPPYDVISPEQREAFAAQNPHNVVGLTLPEQAPDDRSKFVKYMRSASRLAEWTRDGVLAAEAKPALYRYTQTFTAPGYAAPLVRKALIGLIKVEPYEKGVVLPHEQTFPKHKEDRLRILEATRAHLECIYGLFEDDGGGVFQMLSSAPAGEEVVANQEGVENRLEVIDDPAAIQSLVGALADKKVWIADGHHRYETAVHFRSLQGEKSGLIAEDFMMMALSSISDPGLIILPTHRIVDKMPIRANQVDEALGRYFHVDKVPNGRLLERLAKSNAEDTRAFGVALAGGMGVFATLDQPQHALEWMDGEGTERLKLLDVSVLHRVIFEKVLGLTGHDFFRYTRDPEEALASVEQGADAAFLMNPPTVDDMRMIALGGEKMPQKSTYYYPKLLSGLTLWNLSDFDA